jgi:prepilin-type N-terminal cleavage/methylation domain-containing protein
VRARTNQQGFTLVELSIVLFIIAVVTGMAISSGVAVVSSARLSATQQKMKAVDQALLAYRNANDRLPCPADLTEAPGTTNYGVEGANPGTCTGGTPAANHSANGGNYIAVAEGAVPVTTLGLPNDFMYDGWGNHFRYAVNTNMTGLSAFALIPAPLVCGNIRVNDVNGTARSGGVTGGSIYALVSQGPNGHGAYSKNGKVISTGSVNANELTNCHCNSSGTLSTYSPTYVQADLSLDPSNSLDSFDDLVTYREYWQTQTDGYLLPTPMNFTLYVDDDLSGPVYVFHANGSYTQEPSFGTYGYTGGGTLGVPYGIAIDASGNIWLANRYWVEEFNNSGSYISQIGGSGYANGKLISPWGVTFDATGNIWVTDGYNNRVQQFTSGGVWLQTIPSSGCGNVSPAGCTASATNGQFNSPTGIAIDSTGNIWVADNSNNRIEEFSSSGTYINSIGAGYNGISGAIGSTGLGSGQFSAPEGIAIDSSNNIWVADSGNNRVQELNSSGSFLNALGSGYNGVTGAIGSGSTGAGRFNAPDSVAVAPGGVIFVTDTTRMQGFYGTSSASSLNFGCAIYATTSSFGRFDGTHYVAVTTNR